MKSKKNESSLGKSLMKKRKKQPKNKEARFEHVEFVKEDPNKLQSIVEQNPLTEFLQAAELSSKKFEVILLKSLHFLLFFRN